MYLSYGRCALARSCHGEALSAAAVWILFGTYKALGSSQLVSLLINTHAVVYGHLTTGRLCPSLLFCVLLEYTTHLGLTRAHAVVRER